MGYIGSRTHRSQRFIAWPPILKIGMPTDAFPPPAESRQIAGRKRRAPSEWSRLHRRRNFQANLIAQGRRERQLLGRQQGNSPSRCHPALTLVRVSSRRRKAEDGRCRNHLYETGYVASVQEVRRRDPTCALPADHKTLRMYSI